MPTTDTRISKPVPPLSSRSLMQFLRRVKICSDAECWSWTGRVTSEGYGRLAQQWAHRIAYTLAKGPISAGETVDHLCGNRWCVNPSHLEAVSESENRRRGRERPASAKYLSRPRDAARYSRRRDRGLCIQCNTPSEKYRCDRCRESHNERNRRMR